MENKINIAELLKDCPKGMELDCTMYEDVYFDYVDELNIIHCYIQREYNRTSITFNQHGTIGSDIKTKCVIFPKGKTTWKGFHRPFKDGDIVTWKDRGSLVAFIYKERKDVAVVKHHFALYTGSLGTVTSGEISLVEDEIVFATEEEKQKLFKAIKANGYKWNPETKTLEKLPKFKVGNIVRCINNIDSKFKITGIADNYYICENNFRIYFKFQEYWELIPNKFDIGTLKPFDKVLVRTDPYAPIWTIDFYDGYNPNAGIKDQPFGVSGGKYFQQCIPYEGNEHLRGTTNDCNDFYKIWKE